VDNHFVAFFAVTTPINLLMRTMTLIWRWALMKSWRRKRGGWFL